MSGPAELRSFSTHETLGIRAHYTLMHITSSFNIFDYTLINITSSFNDSKQTGAD